MKESPYPTADARCLCYCPGMHLLTPDRRQRREDAPLTCDQLIVILSIDILKRGEVPEIKLGFQSQKQEILEFLSELKDILYDKSFNIDQDLTIIRSKKRKGEEQYSTPYTLVDMDYDTSDVAEHLKELTIREYSETLIDKDDLNPPVLFVFGKDITRKLIYIKLKIKGDQTRHILCVSFHYAKKERSFPYA